MPRRRRLADGLRLALAALPILVLVGLSTLPEPASASRSAGSRVASLIAARSMSSVPPLARVDLVDRPASTEPVAVAAARPALRGPVATPPVPPPSSAPPPTPPAPPPRPGGLRPPSADLLARHARPTWVADAVVSGVPVYDQPFPDRALDVLGSPTLEGLPLVFGVVEVWNGWVQVDLPGPVTGRRGWVRMGDVALRTTDTWALVELGARQLTVVRDGQVVHMARISIGEPASPTPTGSFFVDGLRWLGDGGEVYGAAQISLNGHSPRGQFAIHGTDRPDLLGQAVSDGCLRLGDADIRTVYGLLRAGSAVDVVP